MALIDTQIDRAIKVLRNISQKDIPAATSSAINKTLAKAKTRVVRGVSKKLGIPAKLIRRRAFVGRSTTRTQQGKLTSYLSAIPVASLMKDPKPRKGKRVIKVAGRKYPGAFIGAKEGTKNYQVFKREGKARLPIEIQKIPVKQEILDVTKVVIGRVMRSEHDRLLAHEIKYRIGKYANK